ncbi:MAG: hypothetical protein OXG58_09175 [Gemmatimonadetes bacterium]|nr:hypothetical protein [Gemmatimonadota bacterium]
MKFDPDRVAGLGWGQGAILDRRVAESAWEHAPERVRQGDQDHLLVTSHDCDVLNRSLAKEPLVEVLRARALADHTGQRGPFGSGRNPRALRLSGVSVQGDDVALDLAVHDRWGIPRELLMEEAPADRLPPGEGRLVAEWLAKRYIRSAFPTEFDRRWSGKSKAWRRLLKRHSPWIQGVYLRLHTLRELGGDTPYRCHLLLATPSEVGSLVDWPKTREAIERAFAGFWDELRPTIECEPVEVVTTDLITLDDISRYQRFDADWVSFDDETVATPVVADFRS